MPMLAWLGPEGLRVQNVTRVPSGENPSVLPPPGFGSLMQKLAALTEGQA